MPFPWPALPRKELVILRWRKLEPAPEPLDEPRERGILVLRGRAAAEDMARRCRAPGEPTGRKAGGDAPRDEAEGTGTGRRDALPSSGSASGGATGVSTSGTGSRLAGRAAVRFDGRLVGRVLAAIGGDEAMAND